MSIQTSIETSKGAIKLTLYPDKTPLTVANFVNLAQKGYYDGLNFHRVIDNFMIQGGCPLGSGSGDPGYRFEDEFHALLRHNTPGTLSMANAGPGTNGSQFFITHIPTPHLDDAHTVFGTVDTPSGQAIVDAIEQGDNIMTIDIAGDTAELFAALKDRLTEWNQILAKKFPNLH